MKLNGRTYTLVDDGSLDTVIDVDGTWVRYDQEWASHWRDYHTGVLDLEGFVIFNEDDMIDMTEPVDW